MLCFVTVFCLSKGIDNGARVIDYMFARLQYGVTNTVSIKFGGHRTWRVVLQTMAWLGQLYTVLLLVSQLVVVPGLTWLGCRDTAILLLAVTANITAQILVATNSKVVYIYRPHVLWKLKYFHISANIYDNRLLPVDALEQHHHHHTLRNVQVHGTFRDREGFLCSGRGAGIL